MTNYSDGSGAPSHIKRLAHAIIACDLSTLPEYRGLGSDHPHLLEVANNMMANPGHYGSPGGDKARIYEGFKMAWAVYRFLHPELLKLCDVAAQHALETPNYFLATEVREKLVGKVFVDDSPQQGPPRAGRQR